MSSQRGKSKIMTFDLEDPYADEIGDYIAESGLDPSKFSTSTIRTLSRINEVLI